MAWHIQTRGDVRRFTFLICLAVLGGSLILRQLFLPADLLGRTLLPGAIIAVILAAPISYAIGQRMRQIQLRAVWLEHALCHDQLTGVASRASLLSRANNLGDRHCAVIVADIDRFKDFNDTHGHTAGDQALRQFAAILSGNCRADDLVARFGGEEFVILLGDTTMEHGYAAARRLAQRVRQSPVFFEDRALVLTASFGVAALPPGGSVETAIQQADSALYHAKNEGRDRACLFDPTRATGSDGQVKATANNHTS
ncbi:GGDEF domain-containing protein [uncultured Roseovarius sp.]|uniref:GGDEF domain-containing protein n=1 Tax=uncultured Roseovarius sp. TaxID=293344 RepID=UPI002628C98B|nr:GGDEF domain-containing protein [uncultured Roseovarius sp.]